MVARLLLSLSAVTLVAGILTLSAREDAKPGTPADKILPLFMDEFVSLTPGKGKFPTLVCHRVPTPTALPTTRNPLSP